MKAELTVQTPSKKYPVLISTDLEDLGLSAQLTATGASHCFLIIDEHVNNHHGNHIRKQIESSGIEYYQHIIPAGEPSKSTDQWKNILDFLLEHKIRRNSPVIAAGGGVTGDLAGFAAATVLRGVPLIHLPTTLLAMVDSSIGGKTGINHSTGKNLIGSFYQPEAVLMNTGFLATLPKREWSNGLSEILKYGAIENPDIFNQSDEIFLESPTDSGQSKLSPLIKACVKIKADIVEKDEKESGVRAYLNFGHTFAHALENAAGYGVISHGEAVFAGMIAATRLSQMNGAEIDSIPFNRFRSLYRYNNEIFSIPVQTLVERMYSDKKIINGTLRLVLLNKWGDPFVTDFQDTDAVTEAWDYAFQHLQSTIT